MKTFTKHFENDLIATNEISSAEAFWDFCSICLSKEVYLNWTLADLHRLFMQPCDLGNYVLIKKKIEDVEIQPIAFCTWAWADEIAQKRISVDHLDPHRRDWQSGPYLWVIDFVCPEGFATWLVRFLAEEVFSSGPAKYAYSLRRCKDGKVKKIGRWPIQNSARA